MAFTANATPTRADGKILNYVVEYSGEDMISRTDYIYLPTGLVGEKIVQRTNPNNEGDWKTANAKSTATTTSSAS